MYDLTKLIGFYSYTKDIYGTVSYEYRVWNMQELHKLVTILVAHDYESCCDDIEVYTGEVILSQNAHSWATNQFNKHSPVAVVISTDGYIELQTRE